MSDPFAAYAQKALSTAPAPLLGPIKLRANARSRYGEIVAQLANCTTPAALEAYLEMMRPELAQYAAEIQFLWTGDGDFLGLEKEIERAHARVDDGLDFPRWEPGQIHDANLAL